MSIGVLQVFHYFGKAIISPVLGVQGRGRKDEGNKQHY